MLLVAVCGEFCADGSVELACGGIWFVNWFVGALERVV